MSANDAQSDAFSEEELGKAYDTRILMRLWPYVRRFRRQVAMTLLLFVPLFALELTPAWRQRGESLHAVPAPGVDVAPRDKPCPGVAGYIALTMLASAKLVAGTGSRVIAAAHGPLLVDLDARHCCHCRAVAAHPLATPHTWERG